MFTNADNNPNIKKNLRFQYIFDSKDKSTSGQVFKKKKKKGQSVCK